MILNEAYSFSDVRYLITSKVGERMPARGPDGQMPAIKTSPTILQVSDDQLTFVDEPEKTLLPRGTLLVRLDFPVRFGLLANVWWMRKNVLEKMLQSTGSDAASLRREWQRSSALPKPERGVRTLIIEIVITNEVYAWVGIASPKFNKGGGAEQVYLPNLTKGSGANRSDYAQVHNTYTLSAL
jgi:hypothetical protein